MEHKPNIDDLIKNVVKEEGLDTPPAGFAGRVMGAVMQTTPEVKAYRPLIPKYILAIVVAVLLLVVSFFSMNGSLQTTDGSYINKLANSFKIPHWSFSMPVGISYIVASAMVMLLVQGFVISRIYKKMHS